jgi:glycosyltransferase involved in cell wall biosynthesis
VNAAVIAPVPWFPFKSNVFGARSVFARVPREESTAEGATYHPRYFHVPKVGDSFSPLSFAGAVLREVNRCRLTVDAIDAHFLFPDGVAAVMVARRLGCPVALTARGSDVNVFPDEMVARRWIEWGVKRADSLIAVSSDLGARLSVLAGGRDVSVLHNGVDTCLFKPTPNREALRRELAFSGFTLLSVASLIELKGHHIVIDALRTLSDTTLVIIGHGPLEAELIEQARALGVEQRVRIVGPMAQDRLKDYYAAADATVLASSHEGLPNVVLESLACGTPVIATPTGGAREVLDGTDGGILCERTADAVVAAVRSLRYQPRSRDDVRRVTARFDWGRSTEEVHGVFEHLIQQRHAGKVAA